MPDQRTRPTTLPTKRAPIQTRPPGRFACAVCGNRVDNPLTPVVAEDGSVTIHRQPHESKEERYACGARCCDALIAKLRPAATPDPDVVEYDSFDADLDKIAKDHVDDLVTGRLPPKDVASNIAKDLRRFADISDED